MSAGPSTQAALIQGNQSANGPDASQHSALFYLFQEVSKLASPIHSSFVDSDSPCTWLKDSSLKGSFKVEEEEEVMRSFEMSDHNGSSQGAFSNWKNVEEHIHNNKTTPVGHSPWKVLSLINLQCKRLLHHSDAEESEPISLPPSSPSTIDGLSKAVPKVTDQEVAYDHSNSDFSFRPIVLKNERGQIPPCLSTDETIISTGVSSNPQLCVKESKLSSLKSPSTGKHDTVVMDKTANNSSQFHHEEKKEDKFSGKRQFEWNGKHAEEVTELLTGENITEITKPIPDELINNHPTHSSNFEAVILLNMMKPELTLDYNANLSLPIEAIRDPHLKSYYVSHPSPSTAHHCVLTEEGHPPGGSQDDTGALSSSYQKTPITQANPSKLAQSEPELRSGQRQDAAIPATQLWRAKTPRKQPHPSRSIDIHDPDLQGVMFRMDPELDDSKEQCRLLITSKFRGCCTSLSTHGPGPLSKRSRKPRARMRASQRSMATSSSDEETTGASKDKICASCCTRKTPMWRNAEDGTPLCNACGIRYKKYRVRCVNCWHIPRKEGNSNSTCLKCGNFVRLTSAQLKHTT